MLTDTSAIPANEFLCVFLLKVEVECKHKGLIYQESFLALWIEQWFVKIAQVQFNSNIFTMQKMYWAFSNNVAITSHTCSHMKVVSLTFDQSMFVRGRRPSKYSKLWPDFVNPLLLNLENSNKTNKVTVSL